MGYSGWTRLISKGGQTVVSMNRCFAKRIARTTIAALCIFLFLDSEAYSQARARPGVPDDIAVREVTIWSEGTRMAGDLYLPKSTRDVDRLPAIVMSHGWGGTKAGLVGYAAAFAAEGYIVLAFDYRGWGKSGGRLVAKDAAATPNADGFADITAQVIRTVVDPFDQVVDIRHAVDFMMGEPKVDTSRIGYWGSSYSGAHAVWVAVHEPRVACVVGQVGAADSLDLARTSWKGMDIVEMARERAIARARGEADPVPQGSDKAPNLNGWAILEKVVRYRPVEDAGKISIPILMIDAENEELFDRHKAGELVIERAKANGAAAKYHVVPGITHYGIYRGEARDEAIALAIEWYGEHLKK